MAGINVHHKILFLDHTDLALHRLVRLQRAPVAGDVIAVRDGDGKPHGITVDRVTLRDEKTHPGHTVLIIAVTVIGRDSIPPDYYREIGYHEVAEQILRMGGE